MQMPGQVQKGPQRDGDATMPAAAPVDGQENEEADGVACP